MPFTLQLSGHNWADATLRHRANSQCFSRRTEREIMSVDCTVLDFAGQVLSSLHSLLVQEGALYKERWGFDFPKEAYEYLRSSL